MSQLSAEQIRTGLSELPSLPAALVEVLNTVNRGDADYTELEAKVVQEPAIASRVLSVANSAFYGMPGEVGSIKEACLVLGIHTIRNLVLAAGMVDMFPAAAANSLDLAALWRHALGTGVAARVIAPYAKVDPETAFTAGLLHDIGKMVLDVHFSASYAAVAQYRDEQQCLLRDAELAVLGIDHGEVGGLAIEHWKLPAEVAAAVREHHAPPDEDPGRMAAVIHLADILSRGLELGDPGDTRIPPLLPHALQRAGVNMDQVSNSLGRIETLYEGSGALLSG